MVNFLRGILFGLLHLLNPKLRKLVLHKCFRVVLLLFKLSSKLWRGPGLDIFFVNFFLNVCSCSAILLRVLRLHNSSDSAGTVKFFFSSRQSHSFSLSGTASRCSLGLLGFHSQKLIGMWSLTNIRIVLCTFWRQLRERSVRHLEALFHFFLLLRRFRRL